MIEGAGRPGGRRTVAGITLRGSRNMGWRLGLCVLGYVGAAVAGRALTGQSRVAHYGRRPGCIAERVAGIAL